MGTIIFYHIKYIQPHHFCLSQFHSTQLLIKHILPMGQTIRYSLSKRNCPRNDNEQDPFRPFLVHILIQVVLSLPQAQIRLCANIESVLRFVYHKFNRIVSYSMCFNEPQELIDCRIKKQLQYTRAQPLVKIQYYTIVKIKHDHSGVVHTPSIHKYNTCNMHGVYGSLPVGTDQHVYETIWALLMFVCIYIYSSPQNLKHHKFKKFNQRPVQLQNDR